MIEREWAEKTQKQGPRDSLASFLRQACSGFPRKHLEGSSLQHHQKGEILRTIIKRMSINGGILKMMGIKDHPPPFYMIVVRTHFIHFCLSWSLVGKSLNFFS